MPADDHAERPRDGPPALNPNGDGMRSANSMQSESAEDGVAPNVNADADDGGGSGDGDGVDGDAQSEESTENAVADGTEPEIESESVGVGVEVEEKAPAPPSMTTRERKQCQEEMVRERTARRLEELRNDKLKEQNEDEMRHRIRERIHPLILRRAHSVRNNAVSLITAFYPKSRLRQSAAPKDVLKAFKRALAHFHPDRTVNQSLADQVEAEEVFKLLSREKDQFQRRAQSKPLRANNSRAHAAYPHRSGHGHGHGQHRSYQSRPTRHGWF